MKKKKLIAILTEEGKLDTIEVASNASAERIELALSEFYSLSNIQWMVINKASAQALETLNRKFGKGQIVRA